jgi:transposase
VRRSRGMKEQLFVRELTAAERRELEAGLKGGEAFVLRRCQILLASSRGEGVGAVAKAVGRSRQTVRNILHDFDARGIESLRRGSHRPKSAKPQLDEAKRQDLKALLHHSPRTFGKPTGRWTLELAAEVAAERGLTAGRVSDETVRRALKAMGTHWKRTKHWITSPDPAYARKKGSATG